MIGIELFLVRGHNGKPFIDEVNASKLQGLGRDFESSQSL